MNANKVYIENSDKAITNKVRGEISHYSIKQVADLLNEDVDNIKYYTNIFDDLLKIEIVNKELEYKNEDIDKLEFLIKLKNKGMSLKEIHEYYNKVSLSENKAPSKSSNLISVEELVTSIINAQDSNFAKLKSELINDIRKSNDDYLESLSQKIIDNQTKNLDNLKDTLTTEIKDLISQNLNLQSEQSLKLSIDFVDKTTQFITEKITECNNDLVSQLHKDFSNYSDATLANNENLVKEVKSFKRVMQDAYYINSEIQHHEQNNKSFLEKLAFLFSNK